MERREFPSYFRTVGIVFNTRARNEKANECRRACSVVADGLAG